MNMTRKDPKQYAVQLISHFLKDFHLDHTLESFQLEIQSKQQSISLDEDVVVDDFVPPKSLLAIVEEHLLSAENGRTSGEKSLALERELENQLLKTSTYPTKYPNSLQCTHSTIHTANIICIQSLSLPSSSSLLKNNPLFTLDGNDTTKDDTVPLLITSSADKSVRITHALTGKLVHILNPDETSTMATVLAIGIHPGNPSIIATAAMNGLVTLYDLEQQSVIQTFKNHKKYVTRVAFSPDGIFLVTASYDRSVNIYHTPDLDSSTRPTYNLVQSIPLHGNVESLSFIPTKTHTFLVGSRDDHRIYMITPSETPSMTTIVPLNMNENGDSWVSFTPMDIQPLQNGKFFLVYTDMASGKIILMNIPDIHTNTNTDTDTSSSASDTTSPVSTTLRHVRTYYGPNIDSFSTPRIILSPCGNYFYATSDDYVIWVFEIASTKCVDKLKGHTGVIRALDTDWTNEWVVSAGYDKEVRIWTREV